MQERPRPATPAPSRPADDRPPGRAHLVLYLLAAVLVAISLWCFVVLGRTEALRAELARHMTWLRQSGELRELLAEGMLRAAGPGQAGTPSVSVARLERLVTATRHLVAGHGSPDLDLATQRLEQRLSDLAAQLDLPATDDDLAEASYAVLTVLPELEAQVQEHVVELYGGLDRLWTSLRSLVLVCLLLCASNLGLLYLVHRRREQLEAAHARAVALASHDALTGAWNRVAILRILRHELSRAERSGRPLGVILLDLDDFGRLNVLLGSREADHVLREVGQRLEAFVRPYDTLGRLGGDSFLVILPSCDSAATAGVADRLHHAVEGDEVEYAHGHVGVRTTLVHETVVTDPEAVAEIDPDLLVHGLQLRVDEARRR